MEKIGNSKDGKLFKCSVCCKLVHNRLSFIAHLDSHQEESSKSEADQKFYTFDGIYQIDQLQTSSVQIYIPRISLIKLEDYYEDKLISLFHKKLLADNAPQKCNFPYPRNRRLFCHFCKVQLKWRETRSSHLPKCTMKPDFVCGVCVIRFPTATTLAAHMRLTHLSAREYACSFCLRRFINLRGIKKHYLQTACKNLMGGKTLEELVKIKPSSVTSLSYDRNKTIPANLPNCESKEDFACEICGIRLPTTGKVAAHMSRIHHSLRKYACAFCSHRFPHVRGLKRHYRETACKTLMVGRSMEEFLTLEHSTLTSVSRVCDAHVKQESEKTQSTFSSEFSCPAKLKTLEDLDLHSQKFHHNAPKYKCEFCEKPYSTLEKLNRHFKRTCLRKIESGKRPQRYHHQNKICRYCKGSFSSKYALSLHVRNACTQKETQLSGGAYHCQHCAKTFQNMMLLRKHCQRVCLPKRSGQRVRFGCENCGATFGFKYGLTRHIFRKSCGQERGKVKTKKEKTSGVKGVPATMKCEIKQEVMENPEEKDQSLSLISIICSPNE